jgi:hypothetical protein
MSILQILPVRKPLNTSILRPKYPKREGGRVPARPRYHTSMRILFIAILTTMTATAQSTAPAPIEIVNLEQHLWTTMAEGEFSTVRDLFTRDFIEVDDRIQSVDSLLVNLRHCKLTSYELRDLQVRILSPDSALTAYHVVDTYNCGTPAKPEVKSYDNNATTVWVRRPNTTRWLAQAHTETPTTPAK